jgi:uncharacterized SAM-binding protein YcdF (DUF218 family)
MYYKCLIVIFIFLVNACSMTSRTARKTVERNKIFVPYDAIIVPGVPFHGENWSERMKMRVCWSKYLYDKGYTKNIIYSGSAVYTKYEEASIMALYAEKLGIPKEHIFKDQRAEHSTENVYYSCLVAKKNGFKNLALATDPFQAKSLKRFIKKFEFPIKLLPIVFDSLDYEKIADIQIIPISAIVDDFVSIMERESFIKRLKGTFGQNIKWQVEDLKTKHLRKKYADRIEE